MHTYCASRLTNHGSYYCRAPGSQTRFELSLSHISPLSSPTSRERSIGTERNFPSVSEFFLRREWGKVPRQLARGPIKGPLISRLETWNQREQRPPPTVSPSAASSRLRRGGNFSEIHYRFPFLRRSRRYNLISRREEGRVGGERWSRGERNCERFPSRAVRSIRRISGRTAYKEATRLHSIGGIKRGHARVVNSRRPGVSPAIGGWLLVPFVRGKGRNGAARAEIGSLAFSILLSMKSLAVLPTRNPFACRVLL